LSIPCIINRTLLGLPLAESVRESREELQVITGGQIISRWLRLAVRVRRLRVELTVVVGYKLVTMIREQYRLEESISWKGSDWKRTDIEKPRFCLDPSEVRGAERDKSHC
jgi:hypothetical protein